MTAWLTDHWKTTLTGLLLIGCNVGSLFFPPLAPFCAPVSSLLTGIGILSAADESVVNQLTQEVKNIAQIVKK